MFAWIGRIIDCSLNKTQRIIQNQSTEIENLNKELKNSRKKSSELEANESKRFDFYNAWKSDLEIKQDNLNKEYDRIRNLYDREERLNLQETRLNNLEAKLKEQSAPTELDGVKGRLSKRKDKKKNNLPTRDQTPSGTDL